MNLSGQIVRMTITRHFTQVDGRRARSRQARLPAGHRALLQASAAKPYLQARRQGET